MGEIDFQDSSGGSVDTEIGERLESALEEGVYEVLGDDFGDFTAGIHGTLVYEADKERVLLYNSDLDWVEDEPKEL